MSKIVRMLDSEKIKKIKADFADKVRKQEERNLFAEYLRAKENKNG